MKTIIRNVLVAFFVCGGVLSLHAQTDEQRSMMARDTDSPALKALSVRFAQEFKENHERAVAVARANGWPLKEVKPDGTVRELIRINDDGTPFYYTTFNEGCAITLRTNRIQPGGVAGLNLDGDKMMVGEWDGGAVLKTHVAMNGSDPKSFKAFNGSGDLGGSAASATHSTHVAGTMVGTGIVNAAGTVEVKGRGMAPKARVNFNDWTNDVKEMVDAVDNYGLLLSNHSYGLSTSSGLPEATFGAYVLESKNWDDTCFAAPYYQPVAAAGNDRDSFTSLNPKKNGHDLLTTHTTSKNVIVVAAVNEVPNYTAANDVVMSSFSNWGPTDDNRIKPDISAKGVHVYSTIDASSTSYDYMDGTSMATPSVTGTLLLLQQHYSNLNSKKYMFSATLRALVAHTADEAGDFPGPDSKFGWGLLNAERAAKVISDVAKGSSIMSQLTLNQGQTYTTTVRATGDGTPLIATLSWTDKGGKVPPSGTIDSTTPVLVNDLDIRVTKDTNTYFPWKLNDVIDNASLQGDNIVDNIEKVEINNAEAGTYTITVKHKGTTLTGLKQNFSLVVSGIEIPLGIEQNDFKEFNVWPNPVKELVNVSINSDLSDEAFVTLYDIQGRRVADSKMEAANGMMAGTLNTSSLNSGVYLVKVTQGKKQSIRKIVKE